VAGRAREARLDLAELLLAEPPGPALGQKRQLSVPEPMSSVRQRPRSIGPPVTMIAGTSAEAAPISMAGVVLSQPESSTTPSSG